MDDKLFNYLNHLRVVDISEFMGTYPFDEPEPSIQFEDVLGMPTHILEKLVKMLEEVEERKYRDIVEDIQENLKEALDLRDQADFSSALDNIEGTLDEQQNNIRFSRDLLEKVFELREQIEEYIEGIGWIEALYGYSPGLFKHIRVLLEKNQDLNLEQPLSDEIQNVITTMHCME